MSRFSKYAWSVLLYNIAVIIWGAYVRASLSGAGCGSHWPLCNGQMIPQAETIKTWVEFAHRATSGLSFISVLVLLVWAFRKFQKGSALRKATSWAMGFILSEALIGAVLVLYGWVAENRSKARVVSIALHLINTLFLIASLTLTARWSEEKYPSKLWSESKPANRWAIALGLGWILVAVTGAMTALGDTLFPSLSLSQGLAEDVAAGSHFLQKLRILHPIFAIALGAAVFLLCSRLRDQPKQGEDSKLPQLATTVMALIVVQWTLGMVNIWLLAPVAIQLTHLAIATLLWSLLVLLWNETRKLGPKTYS